MAPAPAPASDAASAPYASYGSQEASYGDFTAHGAYDTTGLATTQYGTGGFAADPLFGDLPGNGHDTGTYDTGQWSADGSQDTGAYNAYAAQPASAAYDTTGGYDATAWTTGHQPTELTEQGAPSAPGYSWDAGAWPGPDRADSPADPTQHWDWNAQTFESGVYDATQWNHHGDDTAHGTAHDTAGTDGHAAPAESFGTEAFNNDTASFGTAAFDTGADSFAQVTQDTGYGTHATSDGQDAHRQSPYDPDFHDQDTQVSPAHGEPGDTGELPAVALLDEQEDIVSVPRQRAGSRSGSRSRRRTPPKRSALLTVAVPSMCVMGVAGIAAASVGEVTGETGPDTASAVPDSQPVKAVAANAALDTALEDVAAGADDFADRASRTQERIDLKAQQEAELKRAAEEAARKERMRPKFALPVAQHGLSALYGQAGINWMSRHTGIDFPVAYGTPVLAATDGTVRTQYNVAYGNMVIVTAKDGTETWYCHLSSYNVPSGATVKAGDKIAFSGNSGNSTGPHLHFEVRPGGGSSIDPLAWLRSHGLEPA